NYTTENIDVDSPKSIFPAENKDLFTDGMTTIVPIIGGGERLGTLIIGRLTTHFDEDDLVLAEYGATVVGMEILQGISEEKEEELRLYKWRLVHYHLVNLKQLIIFLKN